MSHLDLFVGFVLTLTMALYNLELLPFKPSRLVGLIMAVTCIGYAVLGLISEIEK